MNVLDRFRLDGKRLFITGGSRGFGRAIALAAAEAGADIVLVARDPDALAKTADEVRERGRQAWTFAADVARPAAVRGPLQARARRGGADRHSRQQCRRPQSRRADREVPTSRLGSRFVDLNLTHCFICTKMIGGAMLERGEGRVINIASISGIDRQSRHRRPPLRNGEGGGHPFHPRHRRRLGARAA